jgi:rRNA maturation RNase YbeY
MSVVFHQTIPVTLKKRKQLKSFIHDIFYKEGKRLEILNIIFCSDNYLLGMNQQHLKHNFYTDIITFDLSESTNAPIIAELYISIDRVRDNSKSHKTTFSNELHRVIFHGVLHLCGYKDKKLADIKNIRKKEDSCLNNYLDN